MYYKEIEDLLLKKSFLKEKGTRIYYLLTPIILDESEDYLCITVDLQGEQPVITDCAQLLEAYDYADIDILKLRDELLKKPIDNCYFDGISLCRATDKNSLVLDISDFIKDIVFLEKEIKKMLGE